MMPDIANILAGLSAEHERLQGRLHGIGQVVRLLTQYQEGKIDRVSLDMKLAALYTRSLSNGDGTIWIGEREAYRDVYAQLYKKRRV